jgi:hypothetical protein
MRQLRLRIRKAKHEWQGVEDAFEVPLQRRCPVQAAFAAPYGADGSHGARDARLIPDQPDAFRGGQPQMAGNDRARVGLHGLLVGGWTTRELEIHCLP